jgi:hypothetical protein
MFHVGKEFLLSALGSVGPAEPRRSPRAGIRAGRSRARRRDSTDIIIIAQFIRKVNKEDPPERLIAERKRLKSEDAYDIIKRSLLI